MDRRTWLIFGLTAAIVVIVGLLALSLFLVGGRWGGMMMGPDCPWCGGRGMLGPLGWLGSALACAVPLLLLILAAVGVVWFAASQRPRRQDDQALICPECGREVQPDWRACPYCGHGLEG